MENLKQERKLKMELPIESARFLEKYMVKNTPRSKHIEKMRRMKVREEKNKERYHIEY